MPRAPRSVQSRPDHSSERRRRAAEGRGQTSECLMFAFGDLWPWRSEMEGRVQDRGVTTDLSSFQRSFSWKCSTRRFSDITVLFYDKH
uniref:Uncharacterized protein n=1 Tax=Knipowitschia caucasica TaxID=637954 RepID=A0AAV2KHY9_KNICA